MGLATRIKTLQASIHSKYAQDVQSILIQPEDPLKSAICMTIR